MKINLTETIQMPMVGFGCSYIKDDMAPSCISHAAHLGYRHFDTAETYENERGVGQGIKAFMKEMTLPRE